MFTCKCSVAFPSRCRGLVCSVCLWAFLIILTYFSSVLSSFAIIWLGYREPIASVYLFSCCHAAVSVICPFLTVSYVCLQCVTMAFPGYTCTLFFKRSEKGRYLFRCLFVIYDFGWLFQCCRLGNVRRIHIILI